jgi:hypothetical protein
MSTLSDRAFYAIIIVAWALIIGAVVFVIVNFPQAPQQRSASSQPAQPAQPADPCQTFPETGKTVCGNFLTYWTEHGGVTRQGFPISSEFTEVSDLNSKHYTVQYFERAVFEHHPENQAPYDVLLSLLGTFEYRSKYPKGAPELQLLPREMKPEGGATFSQTGKTVRGIFLDYWLTNGGPLQYGYPISNAFNDHGQSDGKEHIIQYFERAVFEYHLEDQPPYNVQVALLGRFQFEHKYPNGDPGLATPMAAPTQISK